MSFTKNEIEVLNNRDFFYTKKVILNKVWNALENCKIEIQEESELFKKLISNYPILNEIDINRGKISKGENYKDLPYLVLDFPALFNKKNIFTFRTFFWWGNFWSFTFHIQGDFLNTFKNKIITNYSELVSSELKICINQTPWEYTNTSENYIDLNKISKNEIVNLPFIKLTKFCKVDDIDDIPITCKDFFIQVLKILLS